MKKLKSLILRLLPEPIKKALKDIYNNYRFKYRLKCATHYHRKALQQAQKKTEITVTFFLINVSVWKYEEIYMLMDEDKRFNPVVIICPHIRFGDEVMLREMNQAYDSLKRSGHNVVKSFNEKTREWLDVKKVYKPDIVFFTNPWNLTRPEYLIENYSKTLTCYVPYGFKNSYLYQEHFNKPMQNLVWKFFLETEIHKKLSFQYSRNKSVNTVVTCYPGLDRFLKKDYQPVDVWKIKNKRVKRIIWAPHHTIPGFGATLDYSTFLTYCDFMFDIAIKYNDLLQIAFKPHPLLRSKLSLDNVWGKEKTDEYFRKWEKLPNGQVHEGEYIDLFLTSDGMIHDSSSFVIEYLYTYKPVMFLVSDDSISERFNEIGKEALLKLYLGRSKEDIERFINNVIINKQDSMVNMRTEFFNSLVKPPNNVTASENIFNHLKSEIFGNKSF